MKYRAALAWLVVVSLLGISAMAADSKARRRPQPVWDLKALGKAPATYPADGIIAKEVKALFYDGPDFQGKPTRVFAYYGAPPVPAGKKVPAMVLIHGGGGTAFDSWVRLWNSRGYAAIAMDLCGCVPVGSDGKWERHERGGPPGWGGFDQLERRLADQWTGQAVADIVLAHSLIRSFPEVDAARIGVTGISWGGYLTCIVAGVDQRFRFAAPVYGCGFLGENSTWVGQFAAMGEEKAGQWLAQWDPSAYLGDAILPMLWVTGSNDFAYPMDSLQKSYRLARGPRTICLRLRMPHGHGGAGENPVEILVFANHLFNHGTPLAKVTRQGREGNEAWARYESKTPIAKAELNFTTAIGKWQDRKWETIPATLDAARRRVSATLPEGTRVYYLNIVDERELVVSTEHVDLWSGTYP